VNEIMVYAHAADVPQALADLRDALEVACYSLSALDEAAADAPRDGGGWTRKQILGHLVDSAAVNLQRFLRGHVQPGFSLLYPQDEFVELNAYNERSFADVLALWLALNRQLLHVAERISASKLDNLCGQGDGEDWTLRFRIIDHLGHMQHHLDQIRDFRSESR
jgi:hypothetical protein